MFVIAVGAKFILDYCKDMEVGIKLRTPGLAKARKSRGNISILDAKHILASYNC